jgi:hypothetical protein
MIIGSCVKFDVSAAKIDVQELEIIKLLQLTDNTVDDHTLQSIRDCMRQSQDFYAPEAVYTIVPANIIDTSKGSVDVGGTSFLTEKMITRQLQNSDYVALFACTIGNRMEKRIHELFDATDFLEAYLFNLIGSEAADCLAALVHSEIQRVASADGLNATNRFSPGYCKWDVAEQHKLFGFFPDNATPIQLTDSALMNPVKSVSGIVGIGKDAQYKPYQCKACEEGYCIYRDRKR